MANSPSKPLPDWHGPPDSVANRERHSKNELIAEIQFLRQRIAELEAAEEQRSQVETVLIERQRRFQRLIRFLTDYIYTVTIEDGEVVDTYHGPGCVAVTGYTSDDYEEDPELWFRMVHPDDQDLVTDRSQRALAGEDLAPFEHRIYHRDGSIRWIRNTIVLRRDDSGAVVSYDGLMNDVTDRKRAEEEALLKQRQLIQADKMASLGILVSGVAHEINNPNNFILLNAQFMGQTWNDIHPVLEDYYEQHGDFLMAGIPYSEARHTVDEVLNGMLTGSMRIKKIVNNLRKFARDDQGELTGDVNINAVIESAILIVDNLIKQSTRHFQLKLGSGLPTVRGNHQQLEQVVINLISNACHALEDPEQAIAVSTYHDRKTPSLVVVVRDEGCGIPEAHLHRIMDPFFTTKRDSDGTGLGLSISYQIIKNHGGSLRFKSRPGVGTTAAIRLPLTIQPTASD